VWFNFEFLVIKPTQLVWWGWRCACGSMYSHAAYRRTCKTCSHPIIGHAHAWRSPLFELQYYQARLPVPGNRTRVRPLISLYCTSFFLVRVTVHQVPSEFGAVSIYVPHRKSKGSAYSKVKSNRKTEHSIKT
jgi:hypothetical protein